MELIVEVPIYPSESEERVMRAVSALIDLKRVTQERTQEGISFRSDDRRALRPLKEALERQLIRAAARSILQGRLREGELEFELHKQAAYAQRASFVTEEGESPLGPIKVTVRGDASELNELLSYLTGPSKRASANLPKALAMARACLSCSG
ncbi:MAG: RNA-binding domain-containing protein [Thermoprotei archaeon]|nr:RNA-binding domain-containing protein [TACK group archaeon]